LVLKEENLRTQELRQDAFEIEYRKTEILQFGAWLCMVLKVGRFGQQIRNTWKVLKCGVGEGWRRSVGPIM
jgi:hypothetical protein